MIFAQNSRNIHKNCFLRKFLGIVTRKSIGFRVTIPGNKLISGYYYSEINLFPGNNTRKSIDFRVLCPGNCYKKNLISWISPWKWKYFWKYFSMWIQGPGNIDSWKNQTLKISCYVVSENTLTVGLHVWNKENYPTILVPKNKINIRCVPLFHLTHFVFSSVKTLLFLISRVFTDQIVILHCYITLLHYIVTLHCYITHQMDCM